MLVIRGTGNRLIQQLKGAPKNREIHLIHRVSGWSLESEYCNESSRRSFPMLFRVFAGLHPGRGAREGVQSFREARRTGLSVPSCDLSFGALVGQAARNGRCPYRVASHLEYGIL